MPKDKRRKNPIVQISYTFPSTNAKDCRKTIRQFHILLKRRSQLNHRQDPSPVEVEELADIEKEIIRLGGLEKYQQLSVHGQKDERGGGSEKVLITWLKELGLHKTYGGNGRLRCVIFLFFSSG